MTPRKKALMKNTIATIVWFLIGVVVAVIGVMNADMTDWGGFVAAIGALLIIFALSSGGQTKKRIKRSYCPECGEKYDYNDDVEYVVSEEIEKNTSIEAVVDFECTCGNCGNSTEFTEKFTIASIDKNGNVVYKNLGTEAKKYFKC